MILERKRRRHNENIPNKKQDGDSQSDAPLNKKSTVYSSKESAMIAQGPMDDDDENES